MAITTITMLSVLVFLLLGACFAIFAIMLGQVNRLIDAVLAKHLPQFAVSRVIQKERKPTIQDMQVLVGDAPTLSKPSDVDETMSPEFINRMQEFQAFKQEGTP
jgi:hypothetical protein